MTTRIAEAASARAAAGVLAAHRPSQRRSAEDPDGVSRGAVLGTMQPRGASVRLERADGAGSGPGVVGCASVVEQGYEMWDMFGPYTEVVSREAFDATLAASPLVEFTLNHNRGGGLPMAHTRNGTLVLGMTDEGLAYDATVDPTRSDVADMLKALERGDLAESSFKFRIVRGQWSPDYTEYRISEVDLDRGDVSAVNFGANPLATSAIRSLERQVRALDPEDTNMLTQAMALFSAIDNIVDEAQATLAAYLGVPNPDADDMGELAAPAVLEVRRRPELVVPDADVRHRTIPGLS